MFYIIKKWNQLVRIFFDRLLKTKIDSNFMFRIGRQNKRMVHEMNNRGMMTSLLTVGAAGAAIYGIKKEWKVEHFKNYLKRFRRPLIIKMFNK